MLHSIPQNVYKYFNIFYFIKNLKQKNILIKIKNMQIKSGKVKKVSQNYYNNYYNQNNQRNNNNIYYPKRVVINNSADLYKLPVDVIKNSKIYNFSGDYFNEIYEEALKIERNNGIKNLLNEDDADQMEGETYAKVIEEIVNRMYSKNLISDIKIEQIENNIYAFNDKEITLKFDKDGKLKLLDGTDLEKWIIYTFKNK